MDTPFTLMKAKQIKCPECNNSIAEFVWKCPFCGAASPSQENFLIFIKLVGSLIFLYDMIFNENPILFKIGKFFGQFFL
jgi:rubredoxin